MELGKALQVNTTPIPGLLVLELPVHGDNRGWFKENWQREKMVAAGLPDFAPVQNNVSFNDSVGTTRGIHAEPWDKYISVAAGRIFGAWVDVREGPGFGTTFTIEIDSSRAVFVPRGVGNAFQTLEPDTAYTYLVNDHYSLEREYTSVNLADEKLGFDWPIPLAQAEVSAKDLSHPMLGHVMPVPRRKTLVIGSGGQLGRALREAYAEATYVEFVDYPEFDLADPALVSKRPWRDYETIINAAAYTNVNGAETADGRTKAWAINVSSLATLSKIATENHLTLVHVSSDYVFDGSSNRPYRENDPVCPLGVYGQTKAAGDQIVATVPRHYIVRTSWVIGDGPNFVRSMLDLVQSETSPSVVSDQYGRLTFTSDLALAIRHLLEGDAVFGIYNVTGGGPVMSWADVARRVFSLAGSDPRRIRDVSTTEYSYTATGPIAKRPSNSALELSKIRSAGFTPSDLDASLAKYVQFQVRR